MVIELVWRQEVMMTNFTIIRYSEQKYFHWVALSELLDHNCDLSIDFV